MPLEILRGKQHFWYTKPSLGLVGYWRALGRLDWAGYIGYENNEQPKNIKNWPMLFQAILRPIKAKIVCKTFLWLFDTNTVQTVFFVSYLTTETICQFIANLLPIFANLLPIYCQYIAYYIPILTRNLIHLFISFYSTHFSH